MEINGLPLHVLVVHAAVVLTPLAGLACLAYVVPQWRDRLRWPVAVAVVVALGSVWVAYLSGTDFRGTSRFDFLDDPSAAATRDKIETHQDLGSQLRWITTGWAVVALAAVGLHDRKGVIRGVLVGLLVAASLATIVWVIRTGDAGAQSVWGA